MSPSLFKNLWMAAVLAVLLVSATLIQADDGVQADDGRSTSRHEVEKTYNNSPFEYDMRLIRKTDAYNVYRLAYPSPVVTEHEKNNTIPADYYLPAGTESAAAPRPAVVCLHILNGNFELVNMLCSALAGRGIPAIMFKLPYYGERSLPGGRKALLTDPRLFLAALEQGGADVRRTVDLLASRPEVDPEKIGVAGISLGGLLAATTAAGEPRLGRTALILAGGDLFTVIKKADEGREIREFLEKLPADRRAEIEKVVRAADPLSHAAALRRRAKQGRVLMINGTDDRVMPKACAEKLADALGMPERVVWLDGLGHYTAMAALPRIMRTTVDFFAVDLPEGVEPAGGKSSPDYGPRRLVVSLLQGAAGLLNKEPNPGRCHFADVEVTLKLKDNKSAKARLRFVRGSDNRFRLGLKSNRPLNVEFEMGQDDRPWMASAGKAVFRGTKVFPPGAGNDSSTGFQPMKKHGQDGCATQDGETRGPLAFADPKHLLKLQMAGGLIAGVSLSPSLLDNLATFSEETGDDGTRVLRIVPKGNNKSDAISLSMQKGSTTPETLRFSVKGVEGSAKFHVWQMDTVGHASLFHPPAGLPVREVARDDMYRIFSSLFNFAMEMAQ